MIEQLAKEVREPILQGGDVAAVRVAYIDISKPSVADQMRSFDAEGFDEVVIVPLLIATVSSQTNDYLQYLAGMRSEAKVLKQLKNEGFDIYFPRARVSMTTAIDESNVLKKNILRRVLALKGDDSGEDMAVVLVGYGDQAYGQQMEQIMEGLGRYLKIKTDIDTVAFAFCGNLTDYSGEPVVEAINDVFDLEDEVLVVPVLMAVDEMLQLNTIQAAVNAIVTQSKVRYKQDAVLPDPKVNAWVVKQAREAVKRITGAESG